MWIALKIKNKWKIIIFKYLVLKLLNLLNFLNLINFINFFSFSTNLNYNFSNF